MLLFLQPVLSLNVLLLVLRDQIAFELYLLEGLLVFGVCKGCLLSVHFLLLLDLDDGLLQARNGVVAFSDLFFVTFDLLFLLG